MEPNEIVALPAHPLVVHAAVVLLPIAALATILTAIRTHRPSRAPP